MAIDRRTFVAGGLTGVLASSVPALAEGAAGRLIPTLTPFATDFMAERNAPGMILGVADRNGWTETAAYGFADVDARRPIRSDERFHIGSISKSFTALLVMQLVDEGKVALDADITRYLPGLPLQTPYGLVTVHHLLTHTSGLPGSAPAPGWADPRIEQAYAPGRRFFYSNLGYDWLGRIVVACGGEDWSRALRRRVLDPLGMTNTSTVIGSGMHRFEVPSYMRREDDRPFPRRGGLARAAPINFTPGSGCIASTAADMNRYIAMLARRGEGPAGRLISPESFARMTKRHVAAAEFGPKGGYGYGWMTDLVDGRGVIRHTGGMASFMSSIHVDTEAGCGAFASINAQQGYRPVPVTAQALRLCRARAKGGAFPKPPTIDPDADLNLRDYAGEYLRADGGSGLVAVAGRNLSLLVDGRTLTLEPLGDDRFVCSDPSRRLLAFVFRREKPPLDAVEGRPNPVRTLEWGRDSFVRRGGRRPADIEPDREVLSAERLRSYEGLYVADSAWLSCVRIVARDGRLWMDAPDLVAPLASLGGDRFRFADQADSPELLLFTPVGVEPRRLSVADVAMTRVGDPFDELA